MKSTVRRVDSALAEANHSALAHADECQPAVSRRARGFAVSSQRSLGAEPKVRLRWEVEPSYWQSGYKLKIFRSNTNFAADENTKDLALHGHLIGEERADGTMEEHLPEGTHFYTFLLYKKMFLGLFEDPIPLRWSETIPSAKTAISRIEDKLRIQQLKEDHELHGIKSQIAKNEAILALHRSNQKLAALTEERREPSLEEDVRRDVEKLVREKLKKAMTRVELLVAVQDVEKQLKRIPAWKKLDADQRKRLLSDIVADLDADEEFLQP